MDLSCLMSLCEDMNVNIVFIVFLFFFGVLGVCGAFLAGEKNRKQDERIRDQNPSSVASGSPILFE
jgi:hypothetical protein